MQSLRSGQCPHNSGGNNRKAAWAWKARQTRRFLQFLRACPEAARPGLSALLLSGLFSRQRAFAAQAASALAFASAAFEFERVFALFVVFVAVAVGWAVAVLEEYSRHDCYQALKAAGAASCPAVAFF